MNTYTLTSLTAQSKWSMSDYICVSLRISVPFLSDTNMNVHIYPHRAQKVCVLSYVEIHWFWITCLSLKKEQLYFYEWLKDFICLLCQAQVPQSVFKTQPLQPNLLYHFPRVFIILPMLFIVQGKIHSYKPLDYHNRSDNNFYLQQVKIFWNFF